MLRAAVQLSPSLHRVFPRSDALSFPMKKFSLNGCLLPYLCTKARRFPARCFGSLRLMCCFRSLAEDLAQRNQLILKTILHRSEMANHLTTHFDLIAKDEAFAIDIPLSQLLPDIRQQTEDFVDNGYTPGPRQRCNAAVPYWT